MYRVRKGIGDYYQAGSWFCNNFPTWAMTDNQATVCQIGQAAVVTAPTTAQVNACATAADPTACANNLVQSITNQAVTQTQANVQAAVNATPDNPYYGLDVPTIAPFCGAGSTQWITGIDNCTLLEIAAAGIVGLIVLGAIGAAKGRR